MGPRSDNRGYATIRRHRRPTNSALQWVHGRITVVMMVCRISYCVDLRLQWVHGRITVVMDSLFWYERTTRVWLQWVHGRITVVMWLAARSSRTFATLQWVHGRITVVMPVGRRGLGGRC